jgi:uncharacterized protein (TIGR02246 family)
MKLVSLLLLPVLAVSAFAVDETGAVRSVLRSYQAAMEARSVDALGKVVDPDLLILEGTHKNVGWKDYRDNHIGPEMKEWKAFRVADPSVIDVAVAGDWAYAVSQATYTIVLPAKTVVLESVETFVLHRRDGSWRVRHVHSSSRKLREEKP